MAEQSETDYIHGTSPGEQGRLSLLNSLLNEACLQELNLQGGEKIIDFGCGLAQFTRLMARRVRSPEKVIGIERDSNQLAEALRQARENNELDLVELRPGEVSAPPLMKHEWETFDVAHARFLLEHLHDPMAVVQSMVRTLRPGGRIILSDDDHELLRAWPEPPGLPQLWQAYMHSYRLNGTDPAIGRRLIALIHSAGAQPVRNTWVFLEVAAEIPISKTTSTIWLESFSRPERGSCRQGCYLHVSSTRVWLPSERGATRCCLMVWIVLGRGREGIESGATSS